MTRRALGVADRFAVLADDLTGAHASAAMLRQRGVPVSVVWDPNQIPLRGAVVADLRTRDRPGDVEDRAASWAKALISSGRDRFEVRVDTTLRGSPHVELHGLIRAGGWADPLVVAVPAYPSAGRVTRGGVQQVAGMSGRPEELDVAAVLFAGRPTATVDQSITAAGVTAVEQRLREVCAAGIRRVVVDAESDSDLQTAARAVDAVHADDHPVVTMSSGAWLRAYPVLEPRFSIVVYASPTTVNELQLARLRLERPEAVVLTPSDVLAGGSPSLVGTDVVVIETLSTGDGHPELAVRAADAVGALLEADPAGGSGCFAVVISGGHAATCLVERLGAARLDPVDEVLPLCPRGVLRGGQWDGLTVVTKGGQIGDAETLLSLLDAVVTPRKRSAVAATAVPRTD